MDPAAHDLFKRLLETPSPSGFERPIQDHVREYLAPFADRVTTDLHGNVIAVKNPQSRLRVMLEACALTVKVVTMAHVPQKFTDWVRRAGVVDSNVAALRASFLGAATLRSVA